MPSSAITKMRRSVILIMRILVRILVTRCVAFQIHIISKLLAIGLFETAICEG
jgi:hypothetical protein